MVFSIVFTVSLVVLLVVSLVVLGDLDDDSFVALAVVNSAVMGNNVVDFSVVVDSLVVVTSGVVDFSVVVDSFVVTSGVVDFPVVVDSIVVTSEDVDFSVVVDSSAVAPGFVDFSVVVDFVVVSGVVDSFVAVDSVISPVPEVVTGVSVLPFVSDALETLGEVVVPVVLFADADEFRPVSFAAEVALTGEVVKLVFGSGVTMDELTVDVALISEAIVRLFVTFDEVED